MSPHEPATIELLLAHRGWVRGLALRLVRDESAADDVAQDTWLAALRSPPRDAGSARGWLGTVLRNRVRESHRRAARREAREAAAAPREPAPAADEVVASADAHRHVVSTVLMLEEPYRTTVLLLYFDGLSPAAAAERLAVPVDTVRTRARRALETLRARLDRDHGGDRRAWGVALLGLETWNEIARHASAAGSGAAGPSLGTGVAMGMGTAIGAAAAGLVIGVLLTLALRDPAASPGADGETARAPALSAVPHLEGGGAVRPAGASEAAEGAPRGGAGAKSPTADASGPALPAEVRATIRGRALLADGSPVAGVTVRAQISQPFGLPAPREAGPPPRKSADEWAAWARNAARWDAATTREVVTDPSGAFELTGLRDAKYQMAAWIAGMELRPVGREITARPGETFDFRAVAKFPVEVAVERADGAAPGRVYLWWTSAKDANSRGGDWWSADSRTVYFEPGEWSVSAEVRDEELKADPVTVRVGAGMAAPTVHLTLRGIPSIVGRVAVRSEETWESLRIHTVRHDGEGMASDAELANAKERASVRPPDYRFRIDRIEKGTYTVAVSMDGRTMLDRTTVTVGDGPGTCALTMPALLGENAVRLRVTGPDGGPVPEALFALEVRTSNSAGLRGPGRASLMPDGSWLFPISRVNEADRDVPDAQWTVIVHSNRLGERRIPFVRGRDVSFDVAYAEPGSVALTIADYEGGPYAGRISAALVAAGADSPSGPIRMAGSRDEPVPGLDARGRQTFTAVAPGDYDVQVWMAIPETRGLRVASERITVRSGAQDATVRLPPLVEASIAGGAIPAGDRVEVTAARAPGNYYWSFTAKADERGAVRLPPLPVGTYVVAAVAGTERREMLLALAAPGSFAFVPGVLDALDVTIDDPSGALARAGFQSGDRIVAIDGHSFRTSYDVKVLQSGARDNATVPFTVLRAGSETIVTAPPALLSGFTEVGGHWEFTRR